MEEKRALRGTRPDAQVAADSGKHEALVQQERARADTARNEVHLLEQQLDNERRKNCNLADEIRIAKDALSELREELCVLNPAMISQSYEDD